MYACEWPIAAPSGWFSLKNTYRAAIPRDFLIRFSRVLYGINRTLRSRLAALIRYDSYDFSAYEHAGFLILHRFLSVTQRRRPFTLAYYNVPLAAIIPATVSLVSIF